MNSHALTHLRSLSLAAQHRAHIEGHVGQPDGGVAAGVDEVRAPAVRVISATRKAVTIIAAGAQQGLQPAHHIVPVVEQQLYGCCKGRMKLV